MFIRLYYNLPDMKDIDFNTVFGLPLFDTFNQEYLAALAQSAIRSPIQYYTLQGYVSELRVIQHLTELDKVRNVRKIPDYANGHGGDIMFRFGRKDYTMEVKTLSRDGGSVSLAPTRKSDVVKAYRVGTFDFVGVCMSFRNENGLLFARASQLPRHKHDPRFIRTSMTLKSSNDFHPFTFDLTSLLP